MIEIKKISVPQLSPDDLKVISNACSKYAEDLGRLLLMQNTAQQHIHMGILQVFRYDLVKKMTARNQAKAGKLNIEIFTAFVVFDALQHYSNHCDSQLDQAIIRRIVTQLFRDLPTVSDKCLSIHSALNFQD